MLLDKIDFIVKIILGFEIVLKDENDYIENAMIGFRSNSNNTMIQE